MWNLFLKIDQLEPCRGDIGMTNKIWTPQALVDAYLAAISDNKKKLVFLILACGALGLLFALLRLPTVYERQTTTDVYLGTKANVDIINIALRRDASFKFNDADYQELAEILGLTTEQLRSRQMGDLASRAMPLRLMARREMDGSASVMITSAKSLTTEQADRVVRVMISSIKTSMSDPADVRLTIIRQDLESDLLKLLASRPKIGINYSSAVEQLAALCFVSVGTRMSTFCDTLLRQSLHQDSQQTPKNNGSNGAGLTDEDFAKSVRFYTEFGALTNKAYEQIQHVRASPEIEAARGIRLLQKAFSGVAAIDWGPEMKNSLVFETTLAGVLMGLLFSFLVVNFSVRDSDY